MPEEITTLVQQIDLPERFAADRADIIQGPDHRRTFAVEWRRQAQPDVYPDHYHDLMPYTWDPPGDLVECVRARVDVDPDRVSYQHRASALIEELDWMTRTEDQRLGGS